MYEIPASFQWTGNMRNENNPEEENKYYTSGLGNVSKKCKK